MSMAEPAEVVTITCNLSEGGTVTFDVVDVPDVVEDTSWQDTIVAAVGK